MFDMNGIWGGVGLGRTHFRYGWPIIATVIVLVALFATLFAAGVFGSTQGDTLERRMQFIASQLHAPGDTTTQTVASSNVTAAWTIRRQIASMLDRGMSNAQILATMETDYGQAVLANPPRRGFGALAWGLPVVGVVVALALGVWFVRRKSTQLSTQTGAARDEEYVISARAEKEWRSYL